MEWYCWAGVALAVGGIAWIARYVMAGYYMGS